MCRQLRLGGELHCPFIYRIYSSRSCAGGYCVLPFFCDTAELELLVAGARLLATAIEALHPQAVTGEGPLSDER